jgi:N-acetylneuraminic acid mutarotase
VIVGAVDYTVGRVKALVFDTRTRRWTTTSSPLGSRNQPSAVAADGEVIVWGGCCGVAGNGSRAQGMRYDPVEDEWLAMAPSPLGERGGHSAVWTGEEMIVWGGDPSRCQ